MRSLFFGLTVLLMLAWTAMLLGDLYLALAADEQFLAAFDLGSPKEIWSALLASAQSDLWGQAAQARAIVWGLPMVVFSIVAAMTLPAARQ